MQGVPVEQLIEDAQKLMKAFMEQKGAAVIRTLRVEPDKNVVRDAVDSPALKLMRETEELTRLSKMGLLDSGATHEDKLGQSRTL